MSNATVEHKSRKSLGAKPSKDSIARLMDMTCGWSQYLSLYPDGAVDSVTGEEIGALHQSIADELEDVLEADDVAKNAAVREFLVGRVLPILIRKKSGMGSYMEPGS